MRFGIILVALLCCFGIALATSPARAEIYHECDWTPCNDCHDQEYNIPGHQGCTSEGDTLPNTGSCTHSNAFFWTMTQCTLDPTTGITSCNMNGIINCSGVTHYYNADCSGSTAYVRTGRTSAYCGGSSPVSCSCGDLGGCS